MDAMVDFNEVFARLAAEGRAEETVRSGGVSVRLVRVAGCQEGRWDRHDATAETVIVWRGGFRVQFRDHALTLAAGQCCVVPPGAEHCGTSESGAEIVLFQTAV